MMFDPEAFRQLRHGEALLSVRFVAALAQLGGIVECVAHGISSTAYCLRMMD